MPRYFYEASVISGERSSGSIEASDENSAVLELRNQGLFPLKISSIEPRRETAWYRRDIIVFRKPRKLHRSYIELFSLFGEFLRSGFSEFESLKLLHQTQFNIDLTRSLSAVIDDVEEGILPGQALLHQMKDVPTPIAAVLQIDLDKIQLGNLLVEITQALEKSEERRTKVSNALIYPGIVLAATVGLVGMVIFYLVPNLIPLFDGVNASPPQLVAFLNAFSIVLVSNKELALVGSTALVLIIVLGRKKISRAFEWVAMQTKFGSEFTQSRNASEFSLLLSALLSGGVRLPAALRAISSGMRGFFGKSLLRAADDIESGLSASEAISRLSELPGSYVAMLAGAVKSASLLQVLQSQGLYYSKQVDRMSEKLVTLVTPVLILMVGGIVALVVTTISGAVLEINNAAF